MHEIELRAADSDRHRTADLLRRAAGEGRLTLPELDERLGRALGAVTLAQLEDLTADLPLAREASSDTVSTIRPRRGWVLAVMGGSRRHGRWRVPARLTCLSLMGGTNIDLSEAELAPETTITAISVMGGAKIRVPTDARVEVMKIALMGGNDVRTDEPLTGAADGAPRVRLRLFALMGGNAVRRGPEGLGAGRPARGAEGLEAGRPSRGGDGLPEGSASRDGGELTRGD